MIHYFIVELDLPVVTGTCTLNGNPGFGTPLTCPDQSSPTTNIKTYQFTNANIILSTSGIFKCVENVAETPPKLKAGNGVASRATCTVTLSDFIGDPNPDSPALVDTPDIANSGTFFGKLKARNIMANKPVRVLAYQVDNANNHTLVSTHHYIATQLKRSGRDNWVLSCQDVLFRADNEKSQFPKLITGRLSSDITDSQTSITIDGDIADWTPYADYTAVIGSDLLMITNATGSSSSVTLTVVRASTINIGSRTIFNTPESHSAGDEVFRARKFVDADLYDVLAAVFADADIASSYYSASQIQDELDSWLGSLSGSIDAIFYEPTETTRFLDGLCQTLMLDIYTDVSTGNVVVKATSPWSSTAATLTEGGNFNYGSLSIEEPEELYYSRAFLQYDKRKLTQNSDDVNFARSSLAYNTALEGSLYYDEEKVKKLGKSIILSNKSNNIEVADLTVVRFAQRFSNRPQRLTFEVEEVDLNFELADVIEILSADNQDVDGSPRHGVRAQVVQIAPISRGIGRRYKVSTVTYNPYAGSAAGEDIVINNTYDVNLYTAAGGPVSSGTFTFIIGQDVGQNELAQALNSGSIPSGSTVNIVLINGAVLMGKGGNGKTAASGATLDGFSGGDTVTIQSGLTVNIYLNGTTPNFGNGTYAADGYLYAAGGGGAAAYTTDAGVQAFASGGGGRGSTPGVRGVKTDTYPTLGSMTLPADGTTSAPGGGGYAELNGVVAQGAAGGDIGQPGGSSFNGSGGASGRGLISNGSTVNIYTDGETSRFVNGSGDTPASLS